MRTGEVKEIRLKGLTSTQNDYECGDGELQVCHNAINTGDGLRPIQLAETAAELPAGWKGLVFVHHTSQGDVYIMVDGDGNAWWKRKDGDGRTEITEPVTGLFTEGNYQITSVGNVLVVNFRGSAGSTESSGSTVGLHYYRWKEDGGGQYKYIGQAPPDVGLEFSPIYYSGSVNESGEPSYNDGFWVQTHNQNVTIKFRADMQFTQGSMLSYEDAFEDYPEWVNHLLGRVNEVKAEMRRNGLFLEKFFVRTAYRLYDGTYIMQSAPVLIAPTMEDNPMIWPYKINAELKKDTNGSYYWELSVASRLMVKAFVLGVKATASAEDKEKLKDWEDVIDRICVFVTPQMQSYTEDPKHIVLTRKEKIPTYQPSGTYWEKVEDETVIDGEGIDGLTQGISRQTWKQGVYRAYLPDYGVYYGRWASRRWSPPRYSLYGGDIPDSQWELSEGNNADEQNGPSVMESQSISFDTSISDGDFSAKLCHHQKLDVHYSLLDDSLIGNNTVKDYYIRMLTEFGGFHHIVQFEQKPDTLESQVEQQYVFYPLKEYTIEEACRLGTSEDADNKTMEWPYLEQNNSSTIWPRKGEEVSAPVDLSFVKFPKDTLENLTARTDTLTDDYNSWQKVMPELVHTYNGRLNAANLKIGFRDMPWTWLGGQVAEAGQGKVSGQVVITTNGVTTCAPLSEQWYRLWVNAGYLYYPHPDAKRIELIVSPYQAYNWMVFKIDLRSHPFLHGAYFFDEDFNLYEHGTEYDSETAAKAALTKAERTISHPNYMYTSEVDNPFFFPSQGVNAIGSGEIVAVKNAAKAMSEGTAYGSMPLYAFCTDGVWPLSVGTTGLFVATNPPTRETLLGNDPDAALQIDNSIIFLSERGLMQLIGERTTLLSGDLQERFSTFDVDDLPGWTRIMGKFRGNGTNEPNGADGWLEADDFLKFIQGARMAFDYINYRIIVFKPYDADDTGTHTAYVYDLKSKMWATMANTLTSAVEGYPASMVNMVGDNGVTVIGRFDADAQALVGDGMAFYTTRPMKLDKPDVLKTMRTLVERSISHGGAKYLALWGSRDMVNWQLIGAVQGVKMPRISGTPYKYVIVAGWSQLDIHGDVISRLTIEERDKYQDKIR